MNNDFITVEGVLERYSIERTTLYLWRKFKNFPPAASPLNARLFWRRSDLELWEESNTLM